jgi:two-component system, OmpR family, osmolarity sensor histidine kinase EnvZ
VAIPRTQIERPLPWLWMALAAGTALVALLVAYMLMRLLNRPLRQLAGAAASVGRGQYPQPLQADGPDEIRALGGAFNQMLSDLKRTDAERAVLLAGVSHDLRTPLARMRLGVELLHGEAELKTDMSKDIEEMDAIVNQFLDFARGAGDERTRIGDLSTLLREVCDSYARRGTALKLELGAIAPLALRPIAFKRALTNLIDNAIKYGGGEIEVRAGQLDGSVGISVLDRGPGIPAAEIERMVRPFTRLESARTGAGGAGLGLAIVDRIAQLHGGKLTLLPRASGGLEARIELPR